MIEMFSGTFAMQESALRGHLAEFENLKALESKRSMHVRGSQRLGVVDGIATIYIEGPLFKRENWLTQALGFTTYETTRRDLQVALDNPSIEGIALYIDSPGGEATSCDELAHALFEARKKKPIAAYISGTGCSAAYWLATAAGPITVSSAAIVGSVGVVLTQVKREDKTGVRTLDFVSSQSPNKGFAPERLQKMVDDLAGVFISHVAKHRNISKEKVQSWKGGVEVGVKAVKAGMADAVGSFDQMIADLKKRPVPIPVKPLSSVKPAPTAVTQLAMTPPAPTPQLTLAERTRIEAGAKASAQELQRIRDIFAKIGGRSQELASHYAYETTMTADQALADIAKTRASEGWQRAVSGAGSTHH